MNLSLRRTLRTTDQGSCHELALLLRNLWFAEVIAPSRRLAIAAARLTDLAIIDNRVGAVSGIEPAWGERPLLLSELLLRNLQQGGDVWLVTQHNSAGCNRLIARLRDQAGANGLSHRLRTAEVEHLADAGMYGDGFTLSGAIDFVAPAALLSSGSAVLEVHPVGTTPAGLRHSLERICT